MPFIDGIRAISILWLVIFHVLFVLKLFLDPESFANLLRSTPVYMNWVWNADKAVDAFFVISGFLIAGLLFKEHQVTGTLNLKSFYLRRFIRLTPVYWFAIILCFLFTDHNTHTLWANVLYLNNFIPFEEATMEWTWSLAVEEQFYLLFPMFLLLVFFKSSNKWQWLFGLLVLSCLIRLIVMFSYKDVWNANFADMLDPAGGFHDYINGLYVNLYTRFGPFICGVLVAYLYFYKGDQIESFVRSQSGFWVSAVAAGLLVCISFLPVFHPNLQWPAWFQRLYLVTNRVLFGLAICWFVLVSQYPGLLGRVLTKMFAFRFWHIVAQLS